MTSAVLQAQQQPIDIIPWLCVLILAMAYLWLMRRTNKVVEMCQDYVDEQYNRMVQRERRLRWHLNQEALKRHRAEQRLKQANRYY